MLHDRRPSVFMQACFIMGLPPFRYRHALTRTLVSDCEPGLFMSARGETVRCASDRAARSNAVCGQKFLSDIRWGIPSRNCYGSGL